MAYSSIKWNKGTELNTCNWPWDVLLTLIDLWPCLFWQTEWLNNWLTYSLTKSLTDRRTDWPSTNRRTESLNKWQIFIRVSNEKRGTNYDRYIQNIPGLSIVLKLITITKHAKRAIGSILGGVNIGYSNESFHYERFNEWIQISTNNLFSLT